MRYRCQQTWVPLRRTPSSTSEMVSSLIFGETCSLIEQKGEWLNVSCDHDNYQGWIPENYLHQIPSDASTWHEVVRGHRVALVSDKGRLHLSMGSQVPGTTVFLDNAEWKVEDSGSHDHEAIWELASSFLYVPYLWGGRSDCGIDCSGLVQVVFKTAGMGLPRDSSDQFECGLSVDFNDRRPNDLAFFHNREGKIIHVGIVSPEGIIHASGRVRLDLLTESGIENSQSGKITHILAGIKRIL